MPYTEIISRKNEKISFCVKLQKKSFRTENGLFFFEGRKLYKEAVAAGVELTDVFFTKRNESLFDFESSTARFFLVSDEVYSKITLEKSPDGVFCIAKTLDKLHKITTIYNIENDGCALLIESLRDPSNLGMIMRSARAFGIDTLILSRDCADLYNYKCLNASMGAAFVQKCVYCDDLVSTTKALSQSGYSPIAAALSEGSLPLGSLKVNGKTVFAIGNEGHGLSDEMISACDGSVLIPMENNCESLNAAIAASLLMWEVKRSKS